MPAVIPGSQYPLRPLLLATLGPHIQAGTPTPAGRGASLHVRGPVRGSHAEGEGLGMGHGPLEEAGPAGKADHSTGKSFLVTE